ncbi:dihydroorotate dehydrogenase electron transfer subunit [Ornithinibacillus hominis]|uniref:Dihydroorotate dehydrogenase B (NAD(+)), electron transfer subunit n=1 Tax=Ornithinibacillus hominis TaxID=2763055 RepID=A0A923L3N7_9BACI|nr:dihydroorotate dehydrogenase electron transfer subunit [Ornithinibacillus hominis]MBC5635897.1 dihydroorotate dehydrogenase electron transfer subunit [Ornithinibacillus hominis]
MIKREKMQILSKTVIALDTIKMVFHNESISKYAIPGQFLHIQVENHTLRRPISIANCDQDTGTITILFKINGDGTKRLAAYEPGDLVDTLGPLGNGFPIDTDTPSTILLVGGGIGVPPLYYLGKTLKEKGATIISILGFQQKEHVFYEQEFSNLGELYIVTDDGSYGHKGVVTDVLSKVSTYDSYYSCGPLPMLKALTAKLEGKKGYISLEERMGCGIGACFACVLPTKDGNSYKKICKDGPVFASEEVQI